MNNYIMLVAGLAVIATSFLAQGVAFGMSPNRNKPVYPVTRALRVALFSIGVAFSVLAMIRIVYQ
jgi:multisubunit Na+/H+ antiporter MnhB subunit